MSFPIPPNHDHPCSELVTLRETVRNIGLDVEKNTNDLRPLIELAAQINLLMRLSIGGGALAIFNLVLFLINQIK